MKHAAGACSRIPQIDANVNQDPYKILAQRLDALPNGFPPTDDGTELRLLAKLFTPEEAALAAQLHFALETPAEFAARTGRAPKETAAQLKQMAKRGLIRASRIERGLGYGLMPFVIGIYEMQVNRIDAELAQLFEEYYRRSFAEALAVRPQVHRVVPVDRTVRFDMEVHPYESAAEIVESCRAWGVVDCICRKQKALIGEPCGHPLDVCMVMSSTPGAFDNSTQVQALTREEALATLYRAAQAGLVHSVSNYQQELWYICNCCTCSCGVLRGLAQLGAANVIARSAFICQVDVALCQACGACADRCQFAALSVGETAQVSDVRCVGCGVCVPVCPHEALALVRRPDDQILPPPVSETDWRRERAAARGLELGTVL